MTAEKMSQLAFFIGLTSLIISLIAQAKSQEASRANSGR